MSFPRYLFKGKNSLGSTHVKQTPHNPDMMWASNTYLIVFQGRYSTLISVQVDCDTVVQDGRHEDDDPDRGGAKGEGACMIFKKPADVSTHISQNTFKIGIHLSKIITLDPILTLNNLRC